MKKLLLLGSLAVMFLPGFAYAAYNDVSLATTTSLSVNSITLNVSGSQATIESIEVGATTFTVVIKNGSAFQVTAPGRESLSANTGQGQSVNTCNSTESVLGYNLTGTTDTVTVTITPSTTLCAAAAAATSASSKSDAGGGGGAPVVTKPVTPVTPLVANAAAIAAIKTQLITLIQQLIILLNQEIQTMKASGNY